MPTNFDAIPAELRERFTYDPETGKVFYKERKFDNPSPRNKQWNTRFAGKEAGYLHDGYIRVSFDDILIYAHQIAFALMKDYIPNEIDHEDKNKSNNRWNNLREVKHFENSQNVFKRSKNKSGYKGVSWASANNCWRMDIQANGVKYHSYHSTAEDAYLAYQIKSFELHGKFGCNE